MSNGMLFIAVECSQVDAPGCSVAARTLGLDALFGESTVIDFAQGFATSFPGLSIQAGPGVNDGDRFYRFDGDEYARFPAILTTNYVAPDDDVTLELLLFTLDGRAGGGPGIGARLDGFAFDDDANPTSGAIDFDCFVVQDVTAPPNQGFGANVRRDVGGHRVGHLQLFPSVTSANDIHETVSPAGDNNGARRRGVHGWIVQTLGSGGDVADGAFPQGGATMAAPGAWARQLGQGIGPLAPLGADVPSLDAR